MIDTTNTTLSLPPEDLPWMSAVEMSARVNAGTLSVSEIADSVIARIELVNPRINAITYCDYADIRRRAAELDQRIADGHDLGILAGVPFTIKELTSIKGLPLTSGLLALRDNKGSFDAVIYKRMLAAGGLFIGKTNAPEVGFAGLSENSVYGKTHNPWRYGYSAGGSSSGAGAAVAAALGQLAEGGDGGGSVRVPASVCGVVGFKPSLGRIPQTFSGRFGTWAFHGPISRTVTDAALMMNAVVGSDESDPLSLPNDGIDYLTGSTGGVDGWKIAFSPDLGYADVDDEVGEICEAAIKRLTAHGAQVDLAGPKWTNPEQAFWDGVYVPGHASVLGLIDWDSEFAAGRVHPDLFDLVTQAAVVDGKTIGQADEFRGHMWDSLADLLAEYDLLACPTITTTAFAHGRIGPPKLDGSPLRHRLLGWLLTYPFNMMTNPSISIPAGFTAEGLPVGLQLIGRRHADVSVLRAARVLEADLEWAKARPDVG